MRDLAENVELTSGGIHNIQNFRKTDVVLLQQSRVPLYLGERYVEVIDDRICNITWYWRV